MTECLRGAAASLVTAPAAVTESERAHLAALRRALPIQRLTGNGMDYADAQALHALAETGVTWTVAAETIGNGALVRARTAADNRHGATARSAFRHASSCFRFAQSALDADDDEKRRLYARALESFAAAANFDDTPVLRVAIPWRNGSLCGWLMLPRGDAPPPVVIIFGGADGWKEEYHAGACYLIDRGVAALLLDAPGQGETRLFHRVHLTEPPDAALSAAVSYLHERCDVSDGIGIWGNSLGGTFAARAASHDRRIGACCVNSGSAMPNAGFARFPRLREKRFAMVGRRDDVFADAVFDALALPQNRIACPLLQLHGVPDQLFTVSEARPIYDAAPSPEKSLVLWEDGDHCIYNHSHEKHCLIADWFQRRLNRAAPP